MRSQKGKGKGKGNFTINREVETHLYETMAEDLTAHERRHGELNSTYLKVEKISFMMKLMLWHF